MLLYRLKRTSLARDVVSHLRERFGKLVFTTMVRGNERLVEAPSRARPLRGGRLAHLPQDRLQVLGELHVANRSQGIHKDVQLDHAQRQVHVLDIDMRLDLRNGILVGGGHDSADHRAGECDSR